MLETLIQAFQQGTAAHAYIVVGDKNNIPALLLQCAQVVMCETRDLCGHCERCNKVLRGIHQDVVSIPSDASKTRLNVADVAYLINETYKRPVDNSDARVFLVNAVDSVVGIGCEIWQNKLLKTLEEPAEGCYVFIGVTDAEALLPTVRSRCQVLKQDKLTVADLRERLGKMGYDAPTCQMASAMSGGSMFAAERIVANPRVLDAYELALKTACQMTSTKNALAFASEILANKDYVSDFLGFYTLALRESVVYRLAPSLCVLPYFKESIDIICRNYTLPAAEDCIERLTQAKKQLDNGAHLTVTVDKLLVDLLQLRYLRRD